MEKLKQLLLYADVTQEEYEQVRPEIRRTNAEKLRALLGLTLSILLVVLLLSYRMTVLNKNSAAYLVVLAVCVVVACASEILPTKDSRVLSIYIYLFQAAILLLGVYVGTVTCPDQQSTSFPAFLLVIPLVFVLRPIICIERILLAEAVYLVCVVAFKQPGTYELDFFNSILFTILSIVVSTYVQCMLTRSLVSQYQLRDIAEHDLTTGVKNRNAYERNLPQYPERSKENLSCLYVDVNGLHVLNNARGHDAGDLMLRTIATLLREEFGEEDTYRIGGDEFVAFVVDTDGKEVRRRAEAFLHHVRDRGYSVALGGVTRSLQEYTPVQLVKIAEKRMYVAKEAHYRAVPNAVR